MSLSRVESSRNTAGLCLDTSYNVVCLCRHFFFKHLLLGKYADVVSWVGFWPHGIQCQPPHVWGFWPHGIQCGTYWGRALIGSLILGVSKMPEMNGHPVSALHLNNFCGCWYWLWRLFEPNSGPHIRGHNYTVFRKKWMKISDKIANKMLILTS